MIIYIPMCGRIKGSCKLSPSDNSVVKIGVISLRWVVVAIGNQVQIRITCFKVVMKQILFSTWMNKC